MLAVVIACLVGFILLNVLIFGRYVLPAYRRASGLRSIIYTVLMFAYFFGVAFGVIWLLVNQVGFSFIISGFYESFR